MGIEEAFEHVEMLTAIDEAFEHVEMISAIDSAFEHVEMLSAIDEAFAHIDMLSAIDEAFAHIDMLSAVDDAFAHIDMLSAVDSAFEFIANQTESTNMMQVDDESNIDELLAALPSIMAEVESIQASKAGSSTTMTAVIASAGALLAIGAGFVIKNK